MSVYRPGEYISQNLSGIFLEFLRIFTKNSRSFYNFWNTDEKIEIFLKFHSIFTITSQAFSD